MSSPKYYECHITCDLVHKDIIEPLAKKHKFKTSVLKGDEIMGDDKLLYCTCHERTEKLIKRRMEQLFDDLINNNVLVLRKKIEYVILDIRY